MSHLDLSPLSVFYEEMRLKMPVVRALAPGEIPLRYRGLLAHGCDMTPTLEAAHGGAIRLRVLGHAVVDNVLRRLVVLEMESDGKAVEAGAIRIHLDLLPPDARNSVLGLREPFGAILKRNRVDHFSRPTGYFQLEADVLITEALGMERPEILYGRRNTLWNPLGEALAEVVEILPPWQESSRRSGDGW